MKSKPLNKFDLSPDFIAAFTHPLGAVSRPVVGYAQRVGR
jgi:hypothetical protein